MIIPVNRELVLENWDCEKIFSLHPDWSPADEFPKLLKRERNRSDRSGLPLSYIQIHLQYSVDSGPRPVFLFLDKFMQLIDRNTRDYEPRILLNPANIGIFLTDADLEKATSYIKKISERIYVHHQKNRKIYLAVQSITIACYPLVQLMEYHKPDLAPLYEKKIQIASWTPGEKSGTTDGNQLDKESNGAVVKDATPIAEQSSSLGTESDLLEKPYRPYVFFKKVLDFLGALAGIILFAPAMIVITLLIKLTSEGPVLFKQQRLGFRGKPFVFLKFRTMFVNNDDSIHRDYVEKLIQGKNGEINFGTSDQPLYKLENDPRITPLGHKLRKFSLDELPQFFNVIRGSMSLVGPRPPIPYEITSYQNWHYRRIREVKPGITGLWQVYGRSMTTFDEMVRLDLQYVQTRSFLLDMKILLMTLRAVFNTRGAL